MKIRLSIIFIYAVLISSCGNKDSEIKNTSAPGKDSLKGTAISPVMKNYQYVGKYISERDSTNYRELRADGTFSVKDFGVKDEGTYKIDSIVITFNYKSGLIASSKIVSDIMMDTDGELWKRIKN